jgi:hypothetical protein
VVLLLAGFLVLGCESLRGSATLLTSPLWPVLQAAIAAGALWFAWRAQSRLRLAPVLLVGLSFQLAWIALHLGLGVQSDGDSSGVYPKAGNALLSGSYPSSEYPPGAVVLFGLDSLLSIGKAGVRISHAFVMVPLQLATVLLIWRLRSGASRWFAVLVAVWPLDAFFWEFKFDLAPTAALILGLFLADRRRWTLAGAALGIGAALKWTPALAGIVLAIWLVRRGRHVTAVKHVAAMAGTFLLVNLPFLLWSPSAVLAAYRLQGGRGISAESMYYLPPITPLVKSVAVISHDVGAPAWANAAAIGLQITLLLLLITIVLRVQRLRAAVSLAAMAPVVFLLSNRVFSPQYLITFVAAWAFAGSLLCTDARDQLRLGALILAASLCNALVYPTGVRLWPTMAALTFIFGFAATGWVVARALRLSAADAG